MKSDNNDDSNFVLFVRRSLRTCYTCLYAKPGSEFFEDNYFIQQKSGVAEKTNKKAKKITIKQTINTINYL